MTTKLEAYGIALLVAVLAAIALYFYGRHDGTVIERSRWEKAAADAKDQDMKALTQAVSKASEIGERTLAAVGNIKVVHQTINKGIEHEIQTNTVYRNDCFTDSGRLLWNASNRGILPDRAGVTKPIGAMPEGNGAASPGQQGRDPAAKP